MWSTSVYGKVILTGEHSVLRGSPAIVAPLKSKTLSLSWIEKATDLKFIFDPPLTRPLQIFLQTVFDRAVKILDKEITSVRGEILVQSQIPIGSGLGSSAALCVAMARLFESWDWIEKSQIFDFAKNLENFFHGQSSGVDIAAVSSEVPLIFTKEKNSENKDAKTSPSSFRELKILWKPCLAIIDTGVKSSTADCLQQVDQIKKNNPEIFFEAEKMMIQSVDLLQKSLCQFPTQNQGLDALIESFNLARRAFQLWELENESLNRLQHDLQTICHAVAVKPTGSGLGGHVLALWKDESDYQSATARLNSLQKNFSLVLS